MKGIKIQSKRFISCMVILALMLTLFAAVLSLSPIAAASNTWSVGFENYYADYDGTKGYSNTTTEQYRSGTQSAMLTIASASGSSNGAISLKGNGIILKDAAAAEPKNVSSYIPYKDATTAKTYLVMYYAKVSADFTGTLRLDFTNNKWYNTCADGDWLTYTTMTDTAALKADWQFGFKTMNTQSHSDYPYLGVYANNQNTSNTAGTKAYLDDVTVLTYDSTAESVVLVDNNDGSNVTPYVGTIGASVDLTDPTREGYIFGGYYTDAACTTAFDGNYPSTATRIYADWIKIYTEIDFENGYTGVANVLTDGAFAKSGTNYAKLTGTPGVTSPDNNTIALIDENGEYLRYKKDFTYVITGYVKASNNNKIRFDVAKSANGTSDWSYTGWSSAIDVSSSEWTLFKIVHTTETTWGENKCMGIFPKDDLTDTSNTTVLPQAADVYFDNIKITAYKKSETGVVLTKEYGNDEFTHKTGALNSAVPDSANIPGGKEFKGWYSNATLTTRVNDPKFTSNLQTLYAKYAKPDANDSWKIGYEEGTEYDFYVNKSGTPARLSTANVSVTNEEKNTGDYSLKIDAQKTIGSGGGDVASFVFIYDTVEAGSTDEYATKFIYNTQREYIVSFWYKVTNGPVPSGYMQIRKCDWTNANSGDTNLVNKTTWLNLNANTETDKWIYYTTKITTPVGDDNKWSGGLRLNWFSWDSVDCDMFIDDVTITRVDNKLVPATVGLENGPLQLLNDEAFAANNEAQAIRFKYFADATKLNTVDINGLSYKVKSAGMLTALKQFIGDDVSALTVDSTNANIRKVEIEKDSLVDNPQNAAQKRLTTYIDGIKSQFMNTDIASRAYVILESNNGDSDLVIYGTAQSANVYSLLQKAKTAGDTSYNASYEWAGMGVLQ